MSDFFVFAVLYAKKGQEKKLQEDLTALVGPSRKDEGNLAYDLFVQQDDPCRFVFLEHWSSSEAHHKHDTETKHIQRFRAGGIDAVERTELFYTLDRIA
ncbi:antibiotic biosynthesis monooxygenase [Pseudomonas sp. PCH199]|uniref:putative quinol monooxygenase n=1 Tax=unclassified Pseudomonas TaxID=196821 RepID=UPI000BC9FA74|nr:MULTISPECIES: putative quinol monooxygenase [unclassified Pseudomonas]MCW8279111.1 antibiotic biosynthesis monooxygenase [Pseudomonas sp. PCH199]PAM79624.1 antibiotic biosynthesis monooxygenase [Pseudomonas sp. ERMR1:02]